MAFCAVILGLFFVQFILCASRDQFGECFVVHLATANRRITLVHRFDLKIDNITNTTMILSFSEQSEGLASQNPSGNTLNKAEIKSIFAQKLWTKICMVGTDDSDLLAMYES